MSELREAIARAIGTYLEGKNFSVFGGTEAVLSADDFCLPIDTLEVADAALAAIEAQGVRLVWMMPATLPHPPLLSARTEDPPTSSSPSPAPPQGS